MTRLSESNAVVRETSTMYRRRALVVKLKPTYLEIREKSRRDTLMIDYAVLYDFAQKLRWRQQQAEKRAAKLKRFK